MSPQVVTEVCRTPGCSESITERCWCGPCAARLERVKEALAAEEGFEHSMRKQRKRARPHKCSYFECSEYADPKSGRCAWHRNSP